MMQLAFHRTVILWTENSVLQASGRRQALDQEPALDLAGRRVRGMAVDHRTRRGCLKPASRPAQWARSSSRVGAVAPGLGHHHGADHLAPAGSGRPDHGHIGHDGVAGQHGLDLGGRHGLAPGADQVAGAARRCERNPSPSSSARSPVRYQPSTRQAAVASGSSR